MHGAAQRLSEAQAKSVALVCTLGLYERATHKIPVGGAGLGRVTSFVNEEKKKSSSELGLEEARRMAEAKHAAPAKKKAEVTWCSALEVGSPELQLLTLTCWNTPQVDVPHLHTSVGVTPAGLEVTIDYRPRADAAYDSVLPDGSYPEPTSREMFMQGSIRTDFAERFFTPEAVAWPDATRATPSASGVPTPAWYSGPLLVEITLPLTDGGVEAAAAACSAATERWVAWMGEAERLDQRKTMSTFAHDTKVRAAVTAHTAAQLARFFGDAGVEIAAEDAGPTDLAERSGAQRAAAETNFDADERDQTAQDMINLQGKSLWDR